MKIKEILRSTMGDSINLILEHPLGGKIETRSIVKDKKTLILYLSSDKGCNLSCRMCFLTQTGQTQSNPISAADYCYQATEILSLLFRENKLDDIEVIHYNFMAQGEALSNPHFIIDFPKLYQMLKYIASEFVPNASIQYKISSIFPTDSILLKREELGRSWIRGQMLSLDTAVEFYYSLYSLKPEFRKRWLPKAADPDVVGPIFSGLKQGLRLHHALISGKNDTAYDINLIHDWLDRHDLNVSMNIVSYNPFDESCGEESSPEVIKGYVDMIQYSNRVHSVQIIPKRSPDVYAACGMFTS